MKRFGKIVPTLFIAIFIFAFAGMGKMQMLDKEKSLLDSSDSVESLVATMPPVPVEKLTLVEFYAGY
jgi:hypothetical protein